MKYIMFTYLVEDISNLTVALHDVVPRTNHIVTDDVYMRPHVKKQLLDYPKRKELTQLANSLRTALEQTTSLPCVC